MFSNDKINRKLVLRRNYYNRLKFFNKKSQYIHEEYISLDFFVL